MSSEGSDVASVGWQVMEQKTVKGEVPKSHSACEGEQGGR